LREVRTGSIAGRDSADRTAAFGRYRSSTAAGAFFGLILAVGFVVGALVGRWWVLAPVAVGYPFVVFGVWAGWWGNGLSRDDTTGFIVAIVVLITLFALVGAVVGVLARRIVHPPPRRGYWGR
jgi:hypothetical protein